MNKLLSGKWIALIAIVLVMVIFVSLELFLRRQEQNTFKTSYFEYKASELQNLSTINTSLKINYEDTLKSDEKLFELIKKNSIAPTTASRIYAYYFTGMNEGYNLSIKAKGNASGSLSNLANSIICSFFPKDCDQSTNVNDIYSESLSTLVQNQLLKRFVQEQMSIKPIELKRSPYFWSEPMPVTPEAGSWKPWKITNVSEYRAPKPPQYGTKEESEQISKVIQVMKQNSDKTKQAVTYWAGGKGTVTPSGIWLQILESEIKNSAGLSDQKKFEIKANLAQTMIDAFIVCWDNKFYYSTKRPFMRSLAIEPLIPTPNFPSYPSGHSTVSASASSILAFYFPNKAEEFMKMAEEAKDSRIWAGIHFEVDNEEGFKLGKQLAEEVISNLSAD